nr:hypothetical protein [Tanacetum cinerariifolium]
MNLQQRINDSMIELHGTFQAWLQQQKDQVYQKILLCYDDDVDEESSTPLRDIIISELPPCIAITPVLSTKDTKDSLIMGDEYLNTIPEKESDEFIKYSVENIVLIPSKFEDEREYDVPICDDFTSFSNLLFDADNDLSSSDNESFSDEDIPKEIYSNPLFDEEIISIKIDPHHLNAESDLVESLLNQDSSIISSSNIDSLLDEFVGELIFLKSIPSGIDEADCDPEEEIRLIEKLLYDDSSPRPLEKFISKNSNVVIESFSPSPIPIEDSDSLIEEIDLSLTPDDSMPTGIENVDYDSEGDILILEEFLSNDSLSPTENESFHFDIPSSPHPPAKPPDDDIEPNSGILTLKKGYYVSTNEVSLICQLGKGAGAHGGVWERVMTSPNHPTSNSKDVFSSNFPDYTSALPDYSPASPEKTYSSSSNNSFGLVPIVLPTLSPFHDDPYMKVMNAYYAKESPVPPPVIIPPSLMLPSKFDPRDFFVPEELLMAPKRTSTSAAPAMNQTAIWQLIDDRVAAVLEAQTANMANTDNTNRNPELR